MLSIGDLIHPYQEEVVKAFGIKLFSYYPLADHPYHPPRNAGELGNCSFIHLAYTRQRWCQKSLVKRESATGRANGTDSVITPWLGHLSRLS